MFKAMFVAALTACLLAPSLGAACFWIDHIDTDPTYFCTSAQYYTVLTSEPDWCDYAIGDHVYIRVGIGGITTGWFVVPASDGSLPPSGFATGYGGIVGSDCGVTWYILV